MGLVWSFLTFSELSKELLYEILRLRAQVLVVEQESPYQDIDGKDKEAMHLVGTKNGNLVAYSRIFVNGDSDPSVGRVVVSPMYRRKGIGNWIMHMSMRFIKSRLPNRIIKISAQSYLKSFYQNLGFEIDSEEYMWDGIPHVDMVAKPAKY